MNLGGNGGRTLPESVRGWQSTGRLREVGGHKLFVVDTGSGDAPPLVIVHGFPGSSHDWRHVIPTLAKRRRVVAFDMIGFGLSDKPREWSNSLFDQAISVETLLVDLGIDRCALVAHDMGDTVTAELLHRDPARYDSVVLTNGSIFIDMTQFTRGQRLALALPNRVLPFPVPRLIVRRSLAESFTTPVDDSEIDAMVALINHHGGAQMLPKQIRYNIQRRQNQPRWTAALVNYPGPLTAIWGQRDPIAIPAMADRLHQLRPHTTVHRWNDIGHWPSIEAPARLAAAILAGLQ